MTDRRAGFTLIEMLVVVVVSGIIVTAIYQSLFAQHRIQRHSDSVILRQQTLRAGLDVVVGELREISPGDGDVAGAASDSITFRAYRKLGFVCDPDAAGRRMDVWRMGELFVNSPVRDSLLVYAAEDNPPRWRAMEVQNTGTPSSACASGPGGLVGTRIQLKDEDGGKITNVKIGAPVRAFTRATYSYRQIDGQWMLARRMMGDTITVPVLGPLAPPADGGLEFRYYDVSGNLFTPDAGTLNQIERIEVKVAALAPQSLGTVLDSLVSQVHLRGNVR